MELQTRVLTSTAQFPHCKHAKAKGSRQDIDGETNQKNQYARVRRREAIGDHHGTIGAPAAPSTSFTTTKTTTTVKPQQRQQHHHQQHQNTEEQVTTRPNPRVKISQGFANPKAPAHLEHGIRSTTRKNSSNIQIKHDHEHARERDEIAALRAEGKEILRALERSSRRTGFWGMKQS